MRMTHFCHLECNCWLAGKCCTSAQFAVHLLLTPPKCIKHDGLENVSPFKYLKQDCSHYFPFQWHKWLINRGFLTTKRNGPPCYQPSEGWYSQHKDGQLRVVWPWNTWTNWWHVKGVACHEITSKMIKYLYHLVGRDLTVHPDNGSYLFALNKWRAGTGTTLRGINISPW